MSRTTRRGKATALVLLYIFLLSAFAKQANQTNELAANDQARLFGFLVNAAVITVAGLLCTIVILTDRI